MKNCLYILYIGLMSVLIASCQQSLDEVQTLPVLSKAQITFTVALDNINTHSRATWKENDSIAGSEVGVVKDNQIDLSSEDGMQVFLYDLNGNLLGEVTNKEIFKLSENTYKFHGEMVIENLSSETLECCLMVYANCTYAADTFQYNVQYMPMWGVRKTTLNLVKGELTNIAESICLLRSMAKVEVKLHTDIAADFELDSVIVDKYNATGNILPAYGKLDDTESLDLEQVFNPVNASYATNLAFNKINEDEFYVYLPEYRNVGNQASPAKISIYIGDKTYFIEFKNYVDGKPEDNAYNIVRNHSYQYTITSVATNIDVSLEELTYQSMPWQDVDNGNLDFGKEDGDVIN